MSNGKIVVQIGKSNGVLNDRGFYSEKDCDLIESLVSCNKAKLAEYGGSGRIRFLDTSGNMLVQLSVIKGNSFMTDDSKAIVVIRGQNGSIKSCSYYGSEGELDFESSTEEYNLGGVKNYIESLKSFYKSYQVKKGEICAVVVIIDDKNIYDEVIKDKFFDNCYVLLAE